MALGNMLHSQVKQFASQVEQPSQILQQGLSAEDMACCLLVLEHRQFFEATCRSP